MLKHLTIHGQRKNIEAIGLLSSLETLHLSGVTIPNLSFINELTNVYELGFNLVSSNDFDVIKGAGIKSLSVSELRGRVEVDFVGKFPNLQQLRLSYLNKVKKIPKLSSPRSLKCLSISEMKSLTDIASLYDCWNLEALFHAGTATKLRVHDFDAIVNMKKLKFATIGLSSFKRNEEMESKLSSLNILPWSEYNFEYS